MILRGFDRLTADDERALIDFVTASQVRGHDRRPEEYRGGCGSLLLLGGSGLALAAGEAAGLPTPVARGVALTLAILGGRALVASFRGVRRARRLMADPQGWFALAWDGDAVCYRSLGLNLLARWTEVTDVALLDATWGSLDGTLWLHLDGGEKVQIEPRGDDFAGRGIAAWAEDLTAAWTRATGRRPQQRVGPATPGPRTPATPG